MKIIVDNREPTILIDYLKNLVNLSDKDITIEVDNLDLGDILIYKNDITIPDIIIERKSINDLMASLKDGRYNEQSYRLDKYSLQNHNIYYIIEGSLEHVSNSITKQTIYSAIFTLSYFKGFSVINSFNMKQTGEYIFRFADKLMRETKRNSYYRNDENINEDNENKKNENENNENENNENEKKYSSVLKTSKKSNITKDNILEIMLMQIPGVSANVAQILSKNFKNMKNLINSLENNRNCLNDIYINKRKLSRNNNK